MRNRKGSLLHPLLHAGHLIEARLRDRLAEVDLLPRQARVLNVLGSIGETSQRKLAQTFDLAPASMSTMCNRLLASGLIERRVDPDELRASLIRLTPTGESKLEDVRKAWKDMDALIIEALGEEEARTMANLTGKLRDKLGGKIPSRDLKKNS